MKPLPLLFCLLSAVPAFAQDAATSGYESLIAAKKLILPGENGSPSSPQKLSPQEDLRRQRLALARNAPALAAARAALQFEVEVPLNKSNHGGNFGDYAGLRELARQFSQEAAVRLADGDYAGSVNSRLDCIEMGTAMSRGPIIAALVGTAIEAIGRSHIEVAASHLDAAQCQAAIERIDRIESRRAPMREILKFDEQESLDSDLEILTETRENKWTTLAARLQNPFYSLNSQAIAQVDESEFRKNHAQLFEAVIANASLPYQQAKSFKYTGKVDYFTAMGVSLFSKPNFLCIHANQSTQLRLLQAALALRAQKLETGVYPQEFKAPTDLFSASLEPLKYSSDGKTYRLYSVGPDGKDNHGKPLTSFLRFFDPTSGTVLQWKSRGVTADAKGDILAPVF